ncbi:MAG: hypothetical protein WAO98_04925 [Alphaproteobacteria bacterium]
MVANIHTLRERIIGAAQAEDFTIIEAVPLRVELARVVRELVATNPTSAIPEYRELVRPLWAAGQAWVTEPSSLVLATALLKSENGGSFRAAAKKLSDDNDRAQLLAALLARRATRSRPQPQGAA